ncbi:MAG: 37S ribosomal protein S24, mitochondrial [Vezdaea acicularis]|nr:MAG: 37S ribosomal protein S24, mitochondrial [Vezdaea acicularis]
MVALLSKLGSTARTCARLAPANRRPPGYCGRSPRAFSYTSKTKSKEAPNNGDKDAKNSTGTHRSASLSEGAELDDSDTPAPIFTPAERARLEAMLQDPRRHAQNSYYHPVERLPKGRGLMALPEDGDEPDDPFPTSAIEDPDPLVEGDDITPLAHAELDQHREMRQYARLAAWEMPLLSTLAKPFEPPAVDEVLRFRYTTYMGEKHPAENKVVLQFCTSDMPGLTKEQRDKLIKLVGPRYNPETDVVKMSCEMFDTQAQNKRYLGDIVDKLLAEARDSTDTFADIPFDFRHHTFKRKIQFPEHWKITPERQEELEFKRAQRALEEEERTAAGLLVDGAAEIGKVLAATPELSIQAPESGRTRARETVRVRR